MKIKVAATLVLGLMCAGAYAQAPVEAPSGAEAPAAAPAAAPSDAISELQGDSEKVNYAAGYELGQDLKRDAVGLSPEALLEGVKDAIEGNPPEVGAGQRRLALKAIREKREQANLEQSLAFLAANKEKVGVATLPSGLQYKVLSAGSGKTPQATDRVTLNYRSGLADGTELDSSYRHDRPATFQVARVIKGLAEALLRMKEGDKWELYIPPDLAYGRQNLRGRIPPNSALVYEVELLSVEPPAAPPEPPAPRGSRTSDDEAD